MSIIDFKETNEREGDATSERKGTLLEIVNRRYTRNFFALTDNVDDSSATVRAYSDCPQIGDPYNNPYSTTETDPIATCNSVRVSATSSPFLWHVSATYDTSRYVSATLDNPLNIPPEIRWNSVKYERPLVYDLQGVPLVNSSGEYFESVVVEDSRPVLTITRNEETFDPATAVAFQESLNLNLFAGAAPLCAKIEGISGDRARDLGTIYYAVTYEIHFRRETFALFLLDRGFRDINGKLFRDPVDFSPMANETLLNGGGLARTSATAKLSSACGPDDQIITVASPLFFPPGPPGGPPHWYYDVKVDNEVMRVIGGFGTSFWQVMRGYAGTTPASHAVNAAVKLQPYYLRFIPFKVLDFAPLNLPVI